MLIASVSANPVSLLPPKHQEAIEKEAILNHPKFAEIMKSGLEFKGLECRNVRDGQVYYDILMEGCHWEVAVHYLPREDGLCGPARFELEFIEPTNEF